MGGFRFCIRHFNFHVFAFESSEALVARRYLLLAPNQVSRGLLRAPHAMYKYRAQAPLYRLASHIASSHKFAFCTLQVRQKCVIKCQCQTRGGMSYAIPHLPGEGLIPGLVETSLAEWWPYLVQATGDPGRFRFVGWRHSCLASGPSMLAGARKNSNPLP